MKVIIKRTAVVICFSGAISLVGCQQSAPPMSKARFAKAAQMCGLKATTYTYRDGIFLDEPLIDFSGEPDPGKAIRCFEQALGRIDSAIMERGIEHVSYIWEFDS